jgi:DNA-binding transcriptional MerR regulator/DNA-directed RNA polymerase subunit RPC12/RpoP
MSMYTTGEIAKKCKVSVRTVQYYDEKGILIPSELTEGGRRLFSENDVRTLETICFLKELGISLKDIAAILHSEESKEVISLLLEQRAADLGKEIAEKKEQLSNVKKLKEMLETFEDSSEHSIHDISRIMEARKNLKQMYVKMLIPCLFVEALEVAGFVYAILRGNWVPFAVVMALAFLCVSIVFNFWHRNIMYICPQCHTIFKPKKREAFFAGHTSKTRKLTCPECSRKMWCVETYDEGR